MMKTNLLKPVVVFAVIAGTIAACKEKTEIAAVDMEPHGIILENMDTTVSPKDDFYNYVNGNWMKTHEIPEDETMWGGFTILRKKTAENVLGILARAKESNKYAPETDQAKALMIYESELDTVARTKAGIDPIKPTLEKIAAMNTVEDFQKLMSEDAVAVSQPFIGIYAMSNPSNSAMNSAYITPGSLGLPDRDFYTNTDPASEKIRQQYVAHITRMLQFLGDTEESARSQAETILAFETKLAIPRLDKVASRDFRNFNNPRSIVELQKMLPEIKWEQAFKDMGITKKLDTLIVMQPKYMETVKQLFNKPDFDKWRTVMRWSTLNRSADMLTPEIEKANWEFYEKTLKGTQKQKPANERALTTVNGSVGEALGKLYVDEMFPPEAKQKAEAMIANVIAAFEDRIQALDWMSDSTKIKAIEKLDKFTVKIGYPDKWKDYSAMTVKPGQTFYDNMVAVKKWNLDYNLNKIDEPV
ncbi:MAG TPA: M13 family metallopeptidase, partial [Aequorivita sp.]|nr:M13 family metallopeptidase [Aequorivita sp.]